MSEAFVQYKASERLGYESKFAALAKDGVTRVQERAGEYIVYTLRVSLMGSEHCAGSVWRRLSVHGETTLSELSSIIQVAMGWKNQGAHSFRSGDLR